MAQFNQFAPVDDFQRGRRNALSIQGQEQGIAREAAAAPIRNQANELGLQTQQRSFERTGVQNEQSDAVQKATILHNVAKSLASLPENQREAAFSQIEQKLQTFGIETNNIKERGFSDQQMQLAITSTQGFLNDPSKLAQLSAGQKEFASLTEGLSPEQIQEAKLIKLRLKGGAPSASSKIFDVGGVPHIINSDGSVKKVIIDGDNVTTASISESEAAIVKAKKLAEGSAKLTSETISKGFDAIGNINKNILNIDRAISALDRGAGTGAAEQFLPNIKEASVLLNQIQGELALDIVGAVTFGALSKGELDLARDIGLPTGLDEPALKDWLERKKTAQNKYRDYLNTQIQFLDGGGSVPGFLASQQAKLKGEGVINIDAQGNRARVFNDGTFEEL